jgi:hypothetical protein
MRDWFSETGRIRLYQYLWLGCVALAIFLRFTIFADTKDDVRFRFAVVYGVGTWVSVVALNLFEGRRLMSYLKRHHREKWAEITYVPGFGPGGINSFRTLRWLYSKDDLNDPTLERLKREHRDFIRWALTVFLSYVPLLPLLLFG